MKETRLLILICSIAILLPGCSSKTNSNTYNPTQSDTSQISLDIAKEQSKYDTDSDAQLPMYSINIRSKEQLNELRNSLSLKDEELNEYLTNIKGGGAQEREDVEIFLNIVDSLPVFDFFDGKISWISYNAGFSKDKNEFGEFAYITVNSNTNDWVRFEYLLSVDNFDSDLESSENVEVFTDTLRSNDGSVSVFAKSIEKHPTDTGNVITYFCKIDGIITRIVNYTESDEGIEIENIINNVCKSINDSKYK